MLGGSAAAAADTIRHAGILARRQGRPHTGGCPPPCPRKRPGAFALAARAGANKALFRMSPEPHWCLC